MDTKIGLGLAALGRPDYINIRTQRNIDKSEIAFEKRAFDMLNKAYDLGIRYFDTAPSYGKGEKFLMDWQNQKKYKNVDLATKWGYTYVANWKIGYEGAHEIKEHSIEKLLEQWNTSKTLLPNLKVYQIHSATIESGVLENKAVLEQLFQIKKKTGLLIGASTSGATQNMVLEKAMNIIYEGQPLFDVFQVTYNILEQSTFSVLQKAIQNNIKIVIKEGIANGRIFKNTPDALIYLANKYNVGIDAIALRFIIDNLKPYIVLSGAFDETQLTQNLKALDFKLEASEIEILQKIAINPENYWTHRKALAWN